MFTLSKLVESYNLGLDRLPNYIVLKQEKTICIVTYDLEGYRHTDWFTSSEQELDRFRSFINRIVLINEALRKPYTEVHLDPNTRDS